MASSKHKVSLHKKHNSELNMVVNSLRRENAYLKKTLVEMSRQHSEHNKLMERFLSIEAVRLETYQQLTAKDEKITLPSEQPVRKEGMLMDGVSMRRKMSISSSCREMEEIKNRLVSIATRCQCLENKVARKKDSASDEAPSTSNVIDLQKHLTDALEKNKQWLDYDQQREAYVRAVLARMLWLEKKLSETNQACSQQHNDHHSDEKEQMGEMKEHYERLLHKATDQLEVLREEVDTTHESLILTQMCCEERKNEIEELKQQLQSDKMSRESVLEDHHCSEDEEQQLKDEAKDLQCRLDEERRRSANFELQGNLFQKFMLNRHHADQEKMADLERQIKISSQDLEDKKQDCSYLKKQMVRVLKTLQKTKDHVTEQSKKDQQDCSFLECPGCQAEYPASHYRDLMNHLETCLD